MITFLHQKCEVPGCFNKMSIEIYEGLKRQGKPAVCYKHRLLTIDDIKKLYGSK